MLALVAYNPRFPVVDLHDANGGQPGPVPKVHRAVEAPPGSLNAQVEETFTGHAIRERPSGNKQATEGRFAETNDELYEASFGAQFTSSLMQPATMFFGNLQLRIGRGGRWPPGSPAAPSPLATWQAFIQYSRQFLHAAHAARGRT